MATACARGDASRTTEFSPATPVRAGALATFVALKGADLQQQREEMLDDEWRRREVVPFPRLPSQAVYLQPSTARQHSCAGTPKEDLDPGQPGGELPSAKTQPPLAAAGQNGSTR